MLPNLILARPAQRIRKNKLLVLEQYFKELKPYFKSHKTIQKAEMIQDTSVENVDATDTVALNAQIEANQLLYAQILAEKLRKSYS